jgi:ParB-like chromosome segregation protein Spo0J
MRHVIQIILFLLLILAAVACADEAPKLPPQVQQLLDKADADILHIKTVLADKLQVQQEAATKKGNLILALAIKDKIDQLAEEIQKAGPPSIADELAGSYVKADGTVTIVLRADGTYTNSYQNRAGKFKVEKNRITLFGAPNFYLTIKDETTLIEDGGNTFTKR